MLQVKGRMIITRANYMKEKASPSQKEAVLGLLDDQLASRIRDEKIIAMDWYKVDDLVQLLRAMDKVLGRGDLSLLRDIGEYAAEASVKGFISIFFKFGSPDFIIKRATTVWQQFYSVGNMVAQFDGSTKVTLILKDVPSVPPEIFLTIQSWIKRTCELAGGRDVQMETQDGQGGDPSEQFTIRLKWR